MSEVENPPQSQPVSPTPAPASAAVSGTGVLLPNASMGVFSKDIETLKAVAALREDWRFARVTMDAQEGDVHTAIAAYAEYESPDLVIVQTDTIDESFTDKLEDLAGNCDEGTAAIVIGPVNDVYLYRRMIEMGISDYLVRPIETPVLADVISKTLIERLGVTGSSLIAFIGAKGGVGASVLAEAAACGTSEILDQKTMLLDICGGWSTLSVGLGFEPGSTLGEAVRAAEAGDEDSLNRMVHPVNDKFSVLATGGDVMLEPNITAEELEALIDMLMIKYPVVIVDCSQGPEALKKAVMARACQINVVASQNLVTLRQGRSLIQEIRDLRGGEEEGIELIMNMQGLAVKQEIPEKDIEDAMGLRVSAALPFDPAVFQGNEAEGKTLTEDPVGRKLITDHLIPVLQKTLSGSVEIEEQSEKSSGFFGNLFGK